MVAKGAPYQGKGKGPGKKGLGKKMRKESPASSSEEDNWTPKLVKRKEEEKKKRRRTTKTAAGITQGLFDAFRPDPVFSPTDTLSVSYFTKKNN